MSMMTPYMDELDVFSKEAGIGTWVAELFEDKPLREEILKRTSMVGAKIVDRDLSDMSLMAKDFSRANLHRTSFKGSTLKGCVFKGADLSWVDFTGATLVGCDLSGADLRFAIIKGVVFQGCELEGASLKSTVMIDVDFKDSTFKRAQLLELKVGNCIFNLEGALLKNTVFISCGIENLEGSGQPIKVLDSNVSGVKGDFKGSTFKGSEFEGGIEADLYSSNLYECKFSGEVKLKGSGIKGHTLLFFGQGLKTVSLESSSLQHLRFSDTRISLNLKSVVADLLLHKVKGMVSDLPDSSDLSGSRITSSEVSVGFSVNTTKLTNSRIVANKMDILGGRVDLRGSHVKGNDFGGVLSEVILDPKVQQQAQDEVDEFLGEGASLTSITKDLNALVVIVRQTKGVYEDASRRITEHFDKKLTPALHKKLDMLFVLVTYFEYIDNGGKLYNALTDSDSPPVTSINEVYEWVASKTYNMKKRMDILVEAYLDREVLQTELVNPLPSRQDMVDELFLRVGMKVTNLDEYLVLRYFKEQRIVLK